MVSFVVLLVCRRTNDFFCICVIITYNAPWNRHACDGNSNSHIVLIYETNGHEQVMTIIWSNICCDLWASGWEWCSRSTSNNRKTNTQNWHTWLLPLLKSFYVKITHLHSFIVAYHSFSTMRAPHFEKTTLFKICTDRLSIVEQKKNNSYQCCYCCWCCWMCCTVNAIRKHHLYPYTIAKLKDDTKWKKSIVSMKIASEKWHCRISGNWGVLLLLIFLWVSCPMRPFVFDRSMTETLNASYHTVSMRFYYFARICLFEWWGKCFRLLCTGVRQSYAQFTSEAIFAMSFIFHRSHTDYSFTSAFSAFSLSIHK